MALDWQLSQNYKWQEVLPSFDVLVLSDLCNSPMPIHQIACHNAGRPNRGRQDAPKDLVWWRKVGLSQILSSDLPGRSSVLASGLHWGPLWISSQLLWLLPAGQPCLVTAISETRSSSESVCSVVHLSSPDWGGTHSAPGYGNLLKLMNTPKLMTSGVHPLICALLCVWVFSLRIWEGISILL